MSDDPSPDDATHRDRLEAALDDGGGCPESWRAMTELRDGSDSPNTSRRRFLARAAAVSGLSVAGLQALTREVDAAEQAADVTELTGDDRHNLLGRALGDPRSRHLRRALVADGHEPQVPESHAVRTEVDGERYHTVVVPFESDGDSQVYLTWSDNPQFDVQVAAFDIVHHAPPDDPAYWSITSYRVEAGEVVVDHDELENFLGCDDVAWGCVLTLAGAYAATFASCATCVATSGWLVAACANCIAAILGSAGATLTCDWCND